MQNGVAVAMSHVEVTRLARLLSGWESETDGPLSTRLATALHQLSQLGDLPSGVMLPPQRVLATALGVSRSTVNGAYTELRDSGVLVSRQGSGSRLRRTGAPQQAQGGGEGRLRSITGHEHRLVDLSSGALESLPSLRAEVVRGFDPDDLDNYLATDGYYPAGLPLLRSAVADYYCDLGLPTGPDNIIITSGSQQAVWLLCETFVEPGDSVVVEDPSYRGALESVRLRGGRTLSVPATEDGPDLRILATIISRVRPRLLYLLPTAHNPTGATMSETARRRLSQLLTTHNVFTVDDGSPAELLLDRDTPPTLLASLLASNQSATIGTLSKLFWGGLRIGWIRASPEIVRHLTERKKAVDLGAAVLEQLLAVRLLGQLDSARTQRRRWLSERCDHTGHLVSTLAPDWEWKRPSGGSAFWIRLPGVDVVALSALARRHGILITAGTTCSPTDNFREMLRLPFAAPQHSIEHAITILTRLAQTLPATMAGRER